MRGGPISTETSTDEFIKWAVSAFLMESLVDEYAKAEQEEELRKQKMRDALSKRRKKYRASVREVHLPDEYVDKLRKSVGEKRLDLAINAAIWAYSELFDEGLSDMPPYWEEEDEDEGTCRVFRCQT